MTPAITITRHRFIDGAVDILPLILAAMPFGILYGALAQASGLSLWTTMAMSLFVFAGSAQFVAVNLLFTAAPVLVIVIATFFVNLRHLMYSANLLEHVKHIPAPLRAIMAFWLTDETFAVVAKKTSSSYDTPSIHLYYLGSALTMYTSWQLYSLTGYQLGTQIPDPQAWGLDIAMVVAFIGIIVPLLKTTPMWVCAISAFCFSLISKDWPYQSGLTFSMLLSIAIAVLVARIRRQNHA
jgi:4-azaleucine resistance transporter AzlC